MLIASISASYFKHILRILLKEIEENIWVHAYFIIKTLACYLFAILFA